MKPVFRLYQIANILSLDVAAGAVVCAAFFADLFQVSILPQGLVALGLAVWLIYTSDHLQDAKKLKDNASTARHQFHHQHFKVLFAIAFVVVCIEIILIFFLRAQIFRSGIFLMVIVMVYILVNQWLKYGKEIAGALLYCCGVLLPVYSLKPEAFDFKNVLLISPFALIVLTNLILFSWMDFEKDKQDSQQSIITLLGKNAGTIIISILFVGVLIVLTMTFSTTPKDVIIIYSLMIFVLSFIFMAPKYFAKDDRFRYLGDMIFLFPIIHCII